MDERALRELEERLLHPEVRASADALTLLLAEDFVEFGSSGAVYDKSQILRLIPRWPAAQVTITDFAVTELATDVALVTYRAHRHGDTRMVSLRSSLWKRVDGRWQILFHQGTPADRGNHGQGTFVDEEPGSVAESGERGE